MTQFLPTDGVYAYARFDASGTVLVFMNVNDKPVSFDTKRFAERMTGFTKAKNVETDAVINDLSKISLEKHQTLVLELIR
ncbi:MAG: hypothetical protein HC817_14045 [Saprospiraceae bacterium]|nr:hypothetical protein [Saprospiraceae bacterium]